MELRLMARTDPRPHYGQNLPRLDAGGYVRIYAPGHPVAMADGYALEHRMVAWDAGILTDLSMQVHHLNRDRTDNRPENLEAVDGAEHAALHAAENGTITNQYGTWPIGGAVRHGTRTTYTKHRCRCEPCKEAELRYSRDYRARKKAS